MKLRLQVCVNVVYINFQKIKSYYILKFEICRLMSSLNSSFSIISPRSKIAVNSSGVSDKIRIGPEYQVGNIPTLLSLSEQKEGMKQVEESLLLWNPKVRKPESEIVEFVENACKKYNYTPDQAHGLLFWHKMDAKKAKADLEIFTPFPDEWNEEEKKTFNQCLEVHKKNFNKFKDSLPEKSMRSIIDYYYKQKMEKKRKTQVWTVTKENGNKRLRLG